MKNNYKRYIVAIVLFAMVMGRGIHGCMTTFINDGACRVALFNKLDKAFMCIPKNGKRRFGSQDKHAHFVVYVQQPRAKLEVWTPTYRCQQNTCGTNGNIMLRFTDIQKNTGSSDLFSIIKHEPHSSMVSELPMMQKQHCAPCGVE